jgi:quinol monooxygenase YgiN
VPLRESRQQHQKQAEGSILRGSIQRDAQRFADPIVQAMLADEHGACRARAQPDREFVLPVPAGREAPLVEPRLDPVGLQLVRDPLDYALVAARVISSNRDTMYGLIGRMKAVPGQRDALISILLDGTGAMRGCRSYIIAKDPSDADAIWISEVWADQASHQASLSLPSVQQAMARARPLIAGFAERFVTEPVGGHGLPSS